MAKESKKTVKFSPVVKVTLTEAQKELLQNAADAAGIPLSIYVRAAALEKAQVR